MKHYWSCEKSQAKIPGNSKHHSKAPAHGVSNYCKALARNDRIFYSSTILATKKSSAPATLPRSRLYFDWSAVGIYFIYGSPRIRIGIISYLNIFWFRNCKWSIEITDHLVIMEGNAKGQGRKVTSSWTPSPRPVTLEVSPPSQSPGCQTLPPHISSLIRWLHPPKNGTYPYPPKLVLSQTPFFGIHFQYAGIRAECPR